MSVIIQGYQLREIAFGVQVIKLAQTPPSSGSSATLFTVAAAGPVLVTSLLGHVSTALSGSTGAIALGSKPTVGTEETAGIATAGVVGGAEIGTWISAVPLDTGLAGAIQANTHAGTVVYLGTPFVVNPGTIEVTTSVATMTGAIDWYLTYVPLVTGSSVS